MIFFISHFALTFHFTFQSVIQKRNIMAFPSMFRRKKGSLKFLASLAFKDICWEESRHVSGLE